MKLNRNKKIALYIIWVFFHIILFLTSGNFLTHYDSDYFPLPFYKEKMKTTYSYSIYNKSLEVGYTEKNIGTFPEFINKIKNQEKLKALYQTYKKVDSLYPHTFELDSIVFIENMETSILKYGNKRYYSVYDYFPDGFKQYDYSEFIIYLMLPVVLFYFKKFWFSKQK